ncbi:helix-turn-helix domain-containing protein [Succinimonas sp.]|uniref:helix-turn-helix domain-containing protein n=1 Tax=Succinimonas sp. TaxID=1936151 RepID=UPI0038647630
MTGNTLKKLILSEGLSVAEVARRIGTSQQNLTCALAKDDIRTGLLERVAEAMGRPLSFFYGGAFGPVQSVGDNNTQVTQVAGNYSGAPDSDVLEILKMKDEQLLLTIKQVSKAQQQMDRVLDRFCGPKESEDATEN